MAKEDIQWAVLGILILIVVALVVKPMATGEPPNIGLPTPTPEPVTAEPTTIPPTAITLPPTTATATLPTPVPTWDESVKKIGFVDPSTYGVNLTSSLPNSTKIPSGDAAVRGDLTTYATFSGKYSGTTQVINIPFPYWELWYTVDPITTYTRADTESEATAIPTVRSVSGVAVNAQEGSYSSLMPQISIQVMDGTDPNRIVRTVSPPGGIDPTLWEANTNALDKIEDDDKKEAMARTYTDPRPWKEKFYEGQRSYFFIIKTSLINSYTINIKVPSSYIGKY